MIEHLNVAIFVLAVTSLYIEGKAPQRTEFDRIVRFFLFFVAFHNLYTFSYEFLDLPRYIDSAFPFSLVYGPLFYVACKAASDPQYSIRQAIVHFIPFSIAFVFFIFLSFRYQFEFAYRKYYFDALYLTAAVSMISYVLSAIILTRQRIQSELFLKVARLTTIGITLLTSLGLLFLIMTLSWDMPITSTRYLFIRFFIYLALLVQVVAVLHYQVIRLIQFYATQDVDENHKESEISEQVQYQKSLLSDATLKEYESKLLKLIEEEVYKDPDLSLEILARNIGAPKHHITQVLNLKINKGFNQFINEHRVAYACRILEKDEVSSMEDLAYVCGFNSKVSFNRNFKTVTGLTPSQYKSRTSAKVGEKLS